MKKAEHDDMQDEYDFSGGVRGKYAERYAQGTNLVALDPDVAAAFPDSASVNRAPSLLPSAPTEASSSPVRILPLASLPLPAPL